MSEQVVTKTSNPYKIVDFKRDHRKGITAASLKELISKARARFSFPEEDSLTIVLEEDGTEIDDEEYFATLELNTNLMVLCGSQKWKAEGVEKPTPRPNVIDDTDHSGRHLTVGRRRIGSLVSSLHHQPSHITYLAENDLEMLSDMDPDSVDDITADSMFLEQLKEASGRFLAEKRQAQESMTLIEMFSKSTEKEQT